VTRPPIAIRESVAKAVITANRCSQGVASGFNTFTVTPQKSKNRCEHLATAAVR